MLPGLSTIIHQNKCNLLLILNVGKEADYQTVAVILNHKRGENFRPVKKRSRNGLTRFPLRASPNRPLVFSISSRPYLFPSSSTTRANCLFSSASPSLSPCLPPSCQGVYMCPADGRVPNKVERIRGEKTVLLPAMFSLFSSISLPRSLALTVDIFQLMYS